jgi:hypothetical protein
VDIPTKHSSWTVLVLPENNTDIVLQEISDLDAIPYRDRRTSYGRFYSQVNRAQPEALILEDGPDYTEPAKERSKPATNIGDQESGPKMATTSALDNDHFNAFLKEFLGNGQKQPPAHKHLTDDKFWSAAVESCVSVSLGLVIHPKSAEVASRIRHIPLEGSDDAVFLHRIPGLLQVLPHLIWNREKVIDVLSFRLLHNPWKQPGPAFPEIRLDFEINSLNEDERSAEFKGLYALTKDRSGQVMLPSQVVDLCFKRKKIFQAKLDNLENQPDVKQFIEQTKANILDGSGRLRAPGSVLIHVPFAVAELTTSMRKNSPKNAPPSKPTRVGAKVQYTLPEVANKTGILAHYHFIGVEHLQIAGYTFEGYPVRYTSVEAGKLGGKYGNLEILMPTPDPAEKYSKERASAQRIAFAKTSLKLVHLVDQAAHGKLERPGPVVQPAKADEETDQEGMERWTPEYLNQTAMQTSTGHEDEVDGTEERPGGELSETVGHHTTIATRTDAAISSRAEGDASSEAPPAAKGEETIQPIESASDEYPPGRGQSTIPLDTTEHEEDWESAEPKQRAAASG